MFNLVEPNYTNMKLELTGKCKIAFEKWYREGASPCGWFYGEGSEIILTPSMSMFYQLPKPMQYGVYVDFFENVNIWVDINSNVSGEEFSGHISYRDSEGIYRLVNSVAKNTRPEARTASIEKTNELFNENK